jgi:hypothetical protein
MADREEEMKTALNELLGDVDELVRKYRRRYSLSDGTSKDGDGRTGKDIKDGDGGTGKGIRDGNGGTGKKLS